MATRTFSGTGLWSTAACWDTEPANGDAFTISSGADCTFDVDLSGWANGVAGGTITGTLRAEKTLTVSGDGNGTIASEAITGLTPRFMTSYCVYPSVIDDGGGNWHINIYKESGRTTLIAHTGNITGDGAAALTADGSSGVGGTITIANFASIAADTDIVMSGYYHLKTSAAITGAGSLLAGTSTSVPYPEKCRFTITNSANCGLVNMTGAVSLFCKEPTTRWPKLVNTEAVGAQRIELDTDMSADSWYVGDYVALVNVKRGVAAGIEYHVIAAVTSTYIDLVGTVATAKEAGSYCVLLGRNVQLLADSTTSTSIAAVVAAAAGSWLGFEFRGTGRACMSSDVTCAGAYAGAASCSLIAACNSVNLIGAAVSLRASFDAVYGCMHNGFIGGSYGILASDIYVNGIVAGCDQMGNRLVFGEDAILEGNGVNRLISQANVSGGGATIRRVNYGLQYSSGVLEGMTFSDNFVDVMSGSYAGQSPVMSFNHGKVAGTHRSYNGYGYMATDTVAPLTGYAENTIKATPTNGNGWTVFEETVVCKNNVPIVVSGAIKASATGMTGPALIEIVDPSADPLYDSAASALDGYSCPDDTAQHAVSLTATPAAAGETVYAIIRFRVKNASGNAWGAWTYTGANGQTVAEAASGARTTPWSSDLLRRA